MHLGVATGPTASIPWSIAALLSLRLLVVTSILYFDGHICLDRCRAAARSSAYSGSPAFGKDLSIILRASTRTLSDQGHQDSKVQYAHYPRAGRNYA